MSAKSNQLSRAGLTGNSGWLSPNLHVNAPYSSNGGVFAEVWDRRFRIMSWRRVTRAEAKRKKLRLIPCAHCRGAAVRIDHSWPYMVGMNACKRHLDAGCADE